MPLPRLALAGLAACTLMAGCAGKSVKPGPHPAHVPHAGPAEAAAPVGSTMHTDAALPRHTGIPACDDYLASYRACHRAAAIYAPDQIESHYQQMRRSLLRDSLRPEIRPQLAARCNSLAGTLRQALHGKACEADPTTSGSSPH
jgi:hypothetical protein